ncbi:MAG TPA: serine/threonine-protein kinase, partial [Polyangiaceae bacterium]|nr:serine/threonine-protein kinase [Polyangiaceae bacterium]
MIGEVVGGRYKITRRISSGGMGVVCEAIHEATGRRVALKIIRDSESFGEEKDAWLARFKREARAAGTIDTPHITQVFDASTDDATGQPYIAMELLVGNDLSRTLKNLGPLPPTVALKAIAQACVGLERAHDAGVIHRDIKPGNIFLSEGHAGRITVKLVDFGIAKVVEEDPTGETAELTQTGSLLGTPTYMSPEQAKGLKNIDHRADLWALGVVLYKALSDTVPHP